MKLIRTDILTLIFAGIIKQARSTCERHYSSTTPAFFVQNLTTETSTSSKGTETSSSTATTTTTTRTSTSMTTTTISTTTTILTTSTITTTTTTATKTTPNNWLNSSTVLSSTEQINLCAMLPSYIAGVLLYETTRGGFTAKAFHGGCDNVANTVTVIRNNNNIFGL